MELNKTFEELYPSGVKVCESLLDKLSLNGHYMCPGMVFAYGVPVRREGGREGGREGEHYMCPGGVSLWYAGKEGEGRREGGREGG